MTSVSSISVKPNTFKFSVLMLSLSVLLTACGGGGSGGSNSSSSGSTTKTTNSLTPASSTTTTKTAPVVLPANPVTVELPVTTTNPITPATDDIAQNAFDTLNTKRTQCGFGALGYSLELEKAATNHANYLVYISTQNKLTFINHTEATYTGLVGTGTENPYYSGKAVSNRVKTDATKGEKAQVVNYDAAMTAENLSSAGITTTNLSKTVDALQASQTMLNTLLAAPYHIRGLVSPSLTQIGINYNQVEWQNTKNKDIMSVLELVSALPTANTPISPTNILTYPCQGVTGTEYELTDESPNPIPNRNLQTDPIGQPIYLLAPTNKVISSVDATISVNGVSAGNVIKLTKANDPNDKLFANEAFIIPETKLKPATTYTVDYSVTYSTGENVKKTFNFTTKS